MKLMSGVPFGMQVLREVPLTCVDQELRCASVDQLKGLAHLTVFQYEKQ